MNWLEILKKNNIQKCVNWCEKYKIPCNKFSEKINIFLPSPTNVNSNLIPDSSENLKLHLSNSNSNSNLNSNINFHSISD